MQASAEQRRETREELYLDRFLVVELISKSSVLSTHGLVLNISRGGMAVQTLRQLSQGNIAEINFSLSDSSVLTCKGVVAWEKPGGLAGIRFLDPPTSPSQELPQRLRSDASFDNSDSVLPSFAYGNYSCKNEFETTLHLLASRAMQLTNATGAAIAIGDRNGMLCRASVGSAPPLGTKLSPDRGLSGHSLLTGEVILCDDAESDPRANTAAVQQIDLRSIVILPIFVETNVVGLLEVFARDAKHFSSHDLQQLQPLVNALTEAIRGQSIGNGPDADDAIIGAVEEIEETEPDSASYKTYSRFEGRPRVIVIAAILLIFVLAIVWLAYREIAGPTSKSTSRIAGQVSAPKTSPGTPSHLNLVIGFDPPVIRQKIGSTFAVNVVVKGARDLWSAPMQILYDPGKLQVLTITSGNLLNRDGQTATLVDRVDTKVGLINVSISRPLSAPGISGDGVVFTLMFLSKAPGNSTLRVEEARLRDTSTEVLSASGSDAIVLISESASPNANSAAEGEAASRNLPPLPTASIPTLLLQR